MFDCDKQSRNPGGLYLSTIILFQAAKSKYSRQYYKSQPRRKQQDAHINEMTTKITKNDRSIRGTIWFDSISLISKNLLTPGNQSTKHAYNLKQFSGQVPVSIQERIISCI